MKQIDQQANHSLQRAIEEVHLDERRHPDPSGQCLLELLGAVEAHIRDESASVATYERIGRETRDPVVAVVMELLVDDETRHHALLQRIAASLQQRLNWVADAHALPLEVEPPGQIESRQLRDLAHRERTPATALPCLLLDAMAMDGDKHARLLAFVVEHLARPSSTR